MSNYGVSVAITVILTSLTAYYLLYRARELNLGILLSIAAGTIVLGCSFNPAFKLILGLLSERISINTPIALIASLLVVLFIFLLTICVLSLIISIAIPKNFSSIDCGVYIDQFFGNIKNCSAGFFNKQAIYTRSVDTIKESGADNTYDLDFKMKKPVDTNQIIDTMGIEKNEKDQLYIDKAVFDEESVYLEQHDDIASKPVTVESGMTESTVQSLVAKAFENKAAGKKDLAVECYMQALEHEPDKEMIFWIVLDVCTLYKELGLQELAKNILEAIVLRYDTAIKPEIKEGIISNLQ